MASNTPLSALPDPPLVAPDPDPVAAPVAVALPSVTPDPVSLQQAFTALCQALDPLLEDSLPDQLHCHEIQGWYANGNHVVSWSHAVHLLEQVLGQALVR